MKVRYSNNAATTLSSQAEPGHTVLIVSSASQFPILSNSDWMYVTVEEEVIKVTATSGNVFTCEPVTGTHGVGASVENRVTADVLNDAQDADVYTTPGSKPSDATMRHGEMFVNTSDKQFGVGDSSGNPQNLLAVRIHSSSASYVVDDIVAYGGGLWKCLLTHTGAWNEANWEAVSGGGGGMEWVLSSSGTVTAEAGIGTLVYTNTEARQVDLPAGVAGETVGVSDVNGNCSTNNITIVSNGSEPIMGLVENFILDINDASILLTYSDATSGWKITGGNW